MQKTPQTIPLYIGGTFSGASDGRTFERLGPASNALVTQAAAASLADADAAVEAAAGAFASWSALGASVRRKRLLQAADALEAHIPDFIEAGVAETGATADWMGFNASYAANMMREAASLTTQVSGTVVASDLSDAMTLSVRRPCGVVLGIAPWNSPVILAVRAIATALACGNTVVLKASEVCPATHALVGRAMHEAGFGDGVVNVLTNAPADAPALVERLIAAPAVRRVNFTGSAAVGRIIAHHAAEHLKPSLLELGSKAPLLVLDDADVDAAVAAIAFGAFLNQGQICMSTERVVVADAVADELVAKLASKARSLKAGPPGTPGAVLGLLESSRAAQRVQALVIDALELGAELPVDLAVEGACMQPCVVDRVDPRMRLYREESFGPVVSILRVANDDEAIRVANDSEYGLTAAVFSRDMPRAMRVARSLQSGACHINGPTLYDEPQLPMGGVKASGWGRFGGPAGIHEFTDLCSVTLQSGQQTYPI